jgi:hypothetical protein
LAATRKFTAPFPVPPAGDTPVIHVALLAAVHAHPGVAVITMGVPAPPAALIVWDAWSSEYEQPAACWVRVTVCPATVRVAVREVPSGLTATETITVPLPLPLAPEVMVIQLGRPVTLQEHPGVAVTAMVPDPPAEAIVWLLGVRLN